LLLWSERFFSENGVGGLFQASLESIRNSLAEELVKMTEQVNPGIPIRVLLLYLYMCKLNWTFIQCEKLRTEAAALPGLKAELEALKQRHFQALELMGERDEEVSLSLPS
jgi:hypothetical protein